MRKHRKRWLPLAVACVSAFSLMQLPVFAEDTTDANMNLDVVFVIDASTSMKSSDPDQLAEEAATLFEQMGDDTIRVGYVFYSHEIVAEQDLVSKSNAKEMEKFESGISDITLQDNAHTDISLGLTEATNILLSHHDDKRNPAIVLLSDGKTELDGYDDVTRSNADSASELQQTLNTLSVNNIPVYTIFLDNKDVFDNGDMEEIAEKTSAKNYEAKESDDLKDIIQDIFSDFTNTVPISVPTEKDGEEWKSEIPIDNESVYMANVVITENDDATDLKLYTPGGTLVSFDDENTKLISSDNYTLLKMMNPEVGTWELRMNGDANVQPEVTLYNSYYFYAAQTLSDTDINQGETLTIQAELYDGESNAVMNDADFLSTVQAVCEVTDDTGATLQSVSLTADADGVFTGQYTIPDIGVYHFTTTISAKDESFKKTTNEEVISVEKQLVETTEAAFVELRTKPLTKNATISVKDYAVWADDLQVAASYDSSSLHLETLEIDPEEDDITITIDPIKAGYESVTVDLTDSAGGKASLVINVTVQNGWVPICLLAGCLLLIVLIILLVRHLIRPKFKGKTIEMSLIPQGMSIPPQQVLNLPKKKHSCTMEEAFIETKRIGSYDPQNDFRDCTRKFGLDNFWGKVVITATGKDLIVTIPSYRGITFTDGYGTEMTKKTVKSINTIGETIQLMAEDGQVMEWKMKQRD
jgi:Mg-chelatase subunit ChlD